jgi:hypothetical protein
MIPPKNRTSQWQLSASPVPDQKLKQIQARLLMGVIRRAGHRTPTVERMAAIARQRLHHASAQSI